MVKVIERSCTKANREKCVSKISFSIGGDISQQSGARSFKMFSKKVNQSKILRNAKYIDI